MGFCPPYPPSPQWSPLLMTSFMNGIKAYSIDIGNTGIAFMKEGGRIRTAEEVEELKKSLQNIYLLKDDAAKEIIGLVGAKVYKNLVKITTFATKPKFQVESFLRYTYVCD